MSRNELKRIFEIIPGLLTWTTIIGLFVLAFIKPLWVAIFVITFDLYWVIRISYLTSLLVFAYRRLEREKKMDWLAAARNLGTVDGFSVENIYQAVLFPVYKEGPDVVEPSLKALVNANYPQKKIIVVLSVEDRAGEDVYQAMLSLKDVYNGLFFELIVTRHPSDLPGEVKVKGANATWGAKVLKGFLDSKKIPYDKVVISCFDADTCAEKEYFGCLAYHYISVPDRFRSSYQPIPVYNNNIWHARSIARILELGSSFMQMIETMRLEKFVTFSSHSMSFKTLVDVGYWPVDMISDDSVIYWKCFLHFNGRYSVIPLYVTVSMDIATEPGMLATIAKQYRQKRRWAWGIENFPFVMMGFIDNDRIPLITKIRRAFNLIESHYTWAVWAIIITFIAPLPLIFGGGLFRQTAIGYNLPSVSAALFRISLVTLLVCLLISIRLLPPRPYDVRPARTLKMYLQWVMAPVFVAILGSTPAIDAQTRLMLGKYMHFYVTSKSRHYSAPKKSAQVTGV
ncbi:MAG TPA: glycosyltransferase family 2 protein [Candidatus Omnitrophota bacterium]|nr:glycosyltransferase family 2 protein [Candidatus Omnitrophota bacterium]